MAASVDVDGGNDLRLCVQKSVNFAESEPLIFVFFPKIVVKRSTMYQGI